jgi:hypothetical protein
MPNKYRSRDGRTGQAPKPLFGGFNNPKMQHRTGHRSCGSPASDGAPASLAVAMAGKLRGQRLTPNGIAAHTAQPASLADAMGHMLRQRGIVPNGDAHA